MCGDHKNIGQPCTQGADAPDPWPHAPVLNIRREPARTVPRAESGAGVQDLTTHPRNEMVVPWQDVTLAVRPMDKHPTGRYSLTSYDQYLCMKPPLMLWLTCLYLSRALTLRLFSGLASYAGSHTTALSQGLFTLSDMPPAAPAFLVLIALITRSPSRGKLVRWLWARGRILLALSALLDLAVPGALLLLGDSQALTQTLGRVMSEMFDLYCLLYIVGSRRAWDVFRSYPEPEPEAGNGAH